MGIWYYLVCPKHKEVLFLGKYATLTDAVLEWDAYESRGTPVDRPFIEKVILPRGVGCVAFMENHQACNLILGDDLGCIGAGIEEAYGWYGEWKEYVEWFFNEEAPSPNPFF